VEKLGREGEWEYAIHLTEPSDSVKDRPKSKVESGQGKTGQEDTRARR